MFFTNPETAAHGEGEEDENERCDAHLSQDKKERIANHLALRRLLYRMERHEDFVFLEKESPCNEGESQSPREDDSLKVKGNHQQTWHSLLVRAQLCQDLWRTVASQNVEDSEDPEIIAERRREYLELSKRVDRACRRAHVLADKARERHQQQVKLSTKKFAEDGTSTEEPPVDLIEQFFFVNRIEDDQTEANTSEGAKVDGGDVETVTDDGENTEDEDYYDEFRDDDSSASSGKETNDQESKRASKIKNTEELQRAQREQMEEAIAMMARQMKESTQGIQNRIQQQTSKTLNELETVAEQNVTDVTKVADQVKNHVKANQKSSWASWTTMILMVGIFVVSLVTIFAVPKSPDATLATLWAKESDGKTFRSPTTRLLLTAKKRLEDMLMDRSSPVEVDDDDDLTDEEEDYNDFDYDYDEDERLEKERLEMLVREMREQRGGTSRGRRLEPPKDQPNEHETLEEDSILEATPEDDENDEDEEDILLEERDVDEFDNPWGITPEADKGTLEQQQDHVGQQQVESEDVVKLPNAIEDVNVDSILASLQEQQRLREESNQEDEDMNNHAMPPKKLGGNQGPEPKNGLEREGIARKRVSPKDLRVAAASNDIDKVKHHLELAPEHINRQDKHGWTALHMATMNKHTQVVEFLLDYFDPEDPDDPNNIDVFIESYEKKQTAFDLAVERFGLDHPVTQIFVKADWYEEDDDEEEEDEDNDDIENDDEDDEDEEEDGDEGDEDEEEIRRNENEKQEFERIVKEKEKNRQAQLQKDKTLAEDAERAKILQQEKRKRLFGNSLNFNTEDDNTEDDVELRLNRLDALLERDEL